MMYKQLELYSSKEYFLMICSTEGAARQIYPAQTERVGRVRGHLRMQVNFWSSSLKCKVQHLEIGERFLFLDVPVRENPVRILSETGVLGYIVAYSWLEITKA